MYFSPYDDAALAFLMECVRLCSCCCYRMLDRGVDPVVNQVTSAIEVFHWFVTILLGCHYPIVLWYRVPLLLNLTRVGALRFWLLTTTKSDDSARWLHHSKSAVHQKCLVWYPVELEQSVTESARRSTNVESTTYTEPKKLNLVIKLRVEEFLVCGEEAKQRCFCRWTRSVTMWMSQVE